jgi:hypothetical protein
MTTPAFPNGLRVTAQLGITAGGTQYQSRPTAFTADIINDPCVGPTPGAFVVPIQGTQCSLAALNGLFGLCRICNLEDKTAEPYRAFEYGITDPTTHKFYPLGEVWPGESYVVRLSRYIQQDTGTGTGTAPSGTSTMFWFRSLDPSGASAHALVEAFTT